MISFLLLPDKDVLVELLLPTKYTKLPHICWVILGNSECISTQALFCLLMVVSYLLPGVPILVNLIIQRVSLKPFQYLLQVEEKEHHCKAIFLTITLAAHRLVSDSAALWCHWCYLSTQVKMSFAGRKAWKAKWSNIFSLAGSPRLFSWKRKKNIP